MEIEMPIPSAIRQVLLVASPNDISISELITTALRGKGVNVQIADTLTVASRADEFALCIILLRPGQWRTTPTITTAMRSNPRSMIPVLTEPMSLPAGAWSTAAIILKEPLSETVQELEILINKQLQVAARDPYKVQKQHSDSRPREAASRTMAYHKIKRRLGSMSSYALIALLLILLGGLLLHYTLGKHSTSAQDISAQTGGFHAPISAFSQSNSVRVPGPGCNTNNVDWWSVGTRYKAVIPPTATAGQTASTLKETPTPQVVIDNSIVTTCQQHGLYVQHINHYDAFAEVFFQDNTRQALPQHFSTQVTVTALNPSSTAIFELGVRHQNSGINTNDSGYGDDHLQIGVDGRWQTGRTNNVTDQNDATFTRGYVKPAHMLTLGAEVDGPRITFSINGQKITTIVDTTFSLGYAIDFGLSDRGAKSPPSALYSNFSYQPLPATNLTTQSAVATATVQANRNLHATYTAAIPGPGCDRGSGQWLPVMYGTASCQSHGLAISQGANAQYSSYVPFYGPGGTLPTNYTVKVQIDISQSVGGCAGLRTRTDTRVAGYSFTVCSNGYWNIRRYGTNGGQGYSLTDGYVNPQTVYTMLATSRGDRQSLALDGVTVSTVQDATLRTTDHIELTMYAGQGAAGTALFSNFVFTPLP